MLLKLNKIAFARQHTREQESSNIFNKASSSISDIMPFIIPLFFTPVLITSSLFSKEIVLMLANITLGLGYMSNFLYKIYNKEVSKSEVIISSLFLAGLLTLSYFVYPVMLAISFVSVLSLINQMVAAVNLFFLTKNAIVPPCKRIIEKGAQYLGIDISAGYYNKTPLNLKNDRYALDRLFQQAYGYDTFAPQFEKKQIKSFNNLLRKLCSYINKYDESFLGYFLNKKAIAEIENQIHMLLTEGSADSSYAFIRKKIAFKTTKVNLLEAAKDELIEALADPTINATPLRHFFMNVDEKQLCTKRKEILRSGIYCLQEEIVRQKEKLNSLEECLPEDKLIEMKPLKIA